MQLQDLFTPDELEILHVRAERVATPLQEDDRAGYLAALIVTLGEERYAIPLDRITAVYECVSIVPVPCVPRFVAGVANVRGHILSVLDLGVVLGIEGSKNPTEGAMLVTEAGESQMGFRVEVIGEVMELPLGQVNPIPSNMNIIRPDYFQGIFPDGTALLDMNVLLNDPGLTVDDGSDV